MIDLDGHENQNKEKEQMISRGLCGRIKEKIKAKKEKIVMFFLICGIGLLNLKLFDPLTILYLNIIGLSIGTLIYFKVSEINRNGLINYLPNGVRHTILRRSIFDILMDLWYLPTISEYIKLIVKPVLYKLSPEEATKVLEDFEPNVRKVFLTKGLINLFPSKVQLALLPGDPHIEESGSAEIKESLVNILEEERELSSDSTRSDIHLREKENEVQSNSESSKTKDEHSKINLDNQVTPYKGSKNKHTLSESKCSSIVSVGDNYDILIDEKLLNKLNYYNHAGFGRAIGHSSKTKYKKYTDPTIKSSEGQYIHSLSISDSPINPITMNNENIPSIEPDLITDNYSEGLVELKKIKNNNEDFRYYEIEDELSNNGKRILKTIVLESSEKMKLKHLKKEFSRMDLKQYCWDRLEEYHHKQAKKFLKESDNKKMNFFQLFANSLQQQIISKIDYNKLSKAAIIFCLTFLIQIIISKKARRWSVSFLQFAIYMITSLGAGGTLYFLLKKKK